VFTSIPLLRIDNGFQLPASLPLLPPPNPPRNHELIMDAFQTTSLTPILTRCQLEGRVLDERMLYRFLFLPGLEKGGMNWEVSRHEFHLFLRWESSRGSMFFMDREGNLSFVTGRESSSANTIVRGSGSRSGSGIGGRGSAGGTASGTGSRRGRDGRGGRAVQIVRDPRRRDDDAITYAGTDWGDVVRCAQQE
jgi:hypothetical protein